MPDRFDRFTERGRRVLSYAQEESHRLNHGFMDTEHLLLGLLRIHDSVAAAVLSNLNVDTTQTRVALEALSRREQRGRSGQIGLTRSAKKVIELAVTEARRMQHRYIGTEHLLLGCVIQAEGIAARVLAAQGCDIEAVRRATTQYLIEQVRTQRIPGVPADSTPRERDLAALVQNPESLQDAQVALDDALAVVAAAKLSRLERDLLQVLLAPRILQARARLALRSADAGEVEAAREDVEQAVRLLLDSAEVFRRHKTPRLAEALESTCVIVRTALRSR